MAGLGSFVGGFTSGVDTRHKWDDRKRNQKFEDEDRAWADENRDWSREDRGWTEELRDWDREDRDHTLSQRDRARKEQQRLDDLAAAERQAYADAFDSAKGAAAAPPPRRTIDHDTFGQVNHNLSFGPTVGAPQPPAPALAAPGQPMQPNQTDVPPVAPGGEGPMVAPRRGLPGEVGSPDHSHLTVPRAEDPAGGGGETPQITIGDWRQMSRSEREAAGLPTSEIGAQIFFKRFQEGILPGSHPSVDMPPKGVRANDGGIPSDPGMPPPLENPPVRPAPRSIDGSSGPAMTTPTAPGTPMPSTPQQDPGVNRMPQPQMPVPAPLGPTDGTSPRQPGQPVPTDAPNRPGPEQAAPAGTEIAATLGAPAGQDPAPEIPVEAAPSVKAAESMIPAIAPNRRSVDGSTLTFGDTAQTRAPTKAEKGRASAAVKTFMDQYIETSVPQLVEFYLRNGLVEKAQAFDKWAKDSETQKNIAHWSKGVFAASIGDEKGMLSSFMTYYNGINDGVTVVEDESGFTKDAEGNNNGIDFTFSNDKTGETWKQHIEGTEGLLQQGIYGLAPERMFEVLYTQMEAAQKIEAKGIEGDQRIVEAVLKAMGTTGDDKVSKRVAEIAEDINGDFTLGDMTPDGKVAAILQQMEIEARASGAVRQGRYSDDIPMMIPPT